MSLYLIGDVQGCSAALRQLLDTLSFSPSRDKLVLLGDLVNRGPDSAGTLRLLRDLDGAARCLLGNHDLHLLAVHYGARLPGRRDTLQDVLQASDREDLMYWLRQQHMALLDTVGQRELLMVHAGVLPGWTASTTLALAGEVQAALRGPDVAEFLHHMYGNAPNQWSHGLQGHDRLRLIVNALTRLRFCTPEGAMEFSSTAPADQAPAGYLPWFDVPGRCTQTAVVAFGHWSTLGWLGREDVFALDSGCVWGGRLSALRVAPSGAPGTLHTELVQVPCAQCATPGE